MNKVTNYWVSVIIQDNETSKPWLCANSNSCRSKKESLELVDNYRRNYRVLSAWVDIYFKNGNKQTVYHECYINSFGQIGGV